MADNPSGFNIAVTMSFKKEVAGVCGLNRADVEGALKRVCNSKAEVERHLDKLTKYANGYHFCRYQKSESVFNTDTSLEYLQAREDFDIANPPNSEVSQRFLDIASVSPGAVAYVQIVDRFTLADIQSRALGDVEATAFCTLLLYFGALTFDKEIPPKLLIIPNHIVAKRYSTSILRRFALLGSMRNTIRFLALHGNIIAPLKGYQELMAALDIKHGGYSMTVHKHRDSFHIAILENPGLDPQVEYKVMKPSRGSGLVDLVITSSDYSIVTEWKTIQIEFLDVGDSFTWDEKAEALNKLGVDEILKLKFNRREKYKKGTLQRWIKNEVTVQLKSYVCSTEIRELAQNRRFHAHLVLVLGSRKILVREMSMKGNWINQPILAEKM
ncbi:hypothetical protein HOY82DRAFT_651946 [Tuber indicum]|nr:hypothetical protein HOY82DRAFT_651946 [Tuber indicum]